MKEILKKHIEYATLCGLAYREPNITLLKQFNDLGYNYISYLNQNGVQAFILANNEKLICVFRGTDEKSDISKNLDFIGIDFLNGRVHRGIYKLYDSIDGYIEGYMATQRYENVVFTGHSLGGAIALLCSSRYPKSTVVSFGMPRVVNKAFRKNLRVFHFRYVNNCDVIPKIPFNFVHQGQMIYFDYDGNIKEYGFWQKVKDTIRSRWRAFKKKQPFIGIYDHELIRYINKMKQNI